MAAGFDTMGRLKNDQGMKTSKAFLEAFPGHVFKSSTFYAAHSGWRSLTQVERSQLIALGTAKAGYWSEAVNLFKSKRV